MSDEPIRLRPITEEKFRELLGLEPWQPTPDGGFEIVSNEAIPLPPTEQEDET